MEITLEKCYPLENYADLRQIQNKTKFKTPSKPNKLQKLTLVYDIMYGRINLSK